MDALRDATVHTYEPALSSVCAPFVKEVKMMYNSAPGNPGILGPSDTGQINFDRATDWLLESLTAGEIDAVFMDFPAAHVWELQKCDKLAVAQKINLAVSQHLLMFHAEDAQLARDMKAALVWYRNTPAYFELERRHFKTGVVHGWHLCMLQ